MRGEEGEELSLFIDSPRRARFPLLSPGALKYLVTPGIELTDRGLVVPIDGLGILEEDRVRWEV